MPHFYHFLTVKELVNIYLTHVFATFINIFYMSVPPFYANIRIFYDLLESLLRLQYKKWEPPKRLPYEKAF